MDQTRIWEYFQNDRELGDTFEGARSRYEFLARQIRAGQRVLNIGVGRGGLEALLLDQGALVSCLDPSQRSIDELRDRFALGEGAKVGYSQDIPFAARAFDVVIMSEVLEHLNDEVLLSTLREVSRVLDDRGLFIGTVPADENLVENRVMCPNCGEAFHRWGHVQSFSGHRLHELLESFFYDVNLSRRFFGDTDGLNWKGHLLSVIKKTMLRFGVKGSGESYFFSACNKRFVTNNSP